MQSRYLVVACAFACACGSDKKTAEQPFDKAVESLCNGQTGITNARGKELATKLATAKPADRVPLLRAAVAEVGLSDCPALFQNADDQFDVTLVKVASAALEPLEPRQLTLAISPGAIAVDGQLLVAVRDGKVAAEELEGGALGTKIPRLTRFLAAWRQSESQTSNERAEALTMLVDANATFRLLYQALYSAKASEGGFKKFAFAVRGKDGLGALGIDLPDAPPPSASTDHPDPCMRVRIAGPVPDADSTAAPPKDEPEPRPGECAQLVVAVTEDKLLLWSLGGEFGTLTDPKLSVPATVPGQQYPLDTLVPPLTEFVERVWPKDGPPRSERSRHIILMLDAEIPFSVIAQLMATVKATPEGRELFPAPLLSIGFQ